MSARLARFFRSFSALFNSGVPLVRALTILGQDGDDPRLLEVSRGMSTFLQSGHTLSRAMARFPDVFSALHVGLVKVGEESGYLQKILETLSHYEEKRLQITLRLRSDLTYPAFLFGFSCLILVLGPPFLFRGMLEMSAELGVEPPLLTRVLVFLSDGLRSPLVWGLVLVMGVGVLGLARHIAGRQEWVERLTKLAMALPGLGNTLRMLAVTRFSHCLSLQLEAGQSPLLALRLSAGAAGNAVLRRDIVKAVAALEQGQTLVESLKSTEFFPPAFLLFVKAGEAVGAAPYMIARAADLYELELEFTVSSFVQLLEPLMMLCMGLVVGLVIVGTMLPLMEAIKAF